MGQSRNRKNKRNSKGVMKWKGTSQTSSSKQKPGSETSSLSTPSSSGSPPAKTPRMQNPSNADPSCTPSAGRARAGPSTMGDVDPRPSFTTSTPSHVDSSMSASGIVRPDPLPTPEEVASLLSSPVSESTTHDPNFQPVLDQLLQTDLQNISNEGKAIVQSIAKLLNHSLLAAYKQSDERFRLKDIQIAVLNAQNSELQNKISSMERRMAAMESQYRELSDKVDDIDQYERRDTVIVSGNDLPVETETESPAEVIIKTLNSKLALDLSMADINVAHRLGRKNSTRPRPIIVKLQSRTRKSQIIRTCIAKRPQLYINESLTHTRRRMYGNLLKIRKENPGLIQSMYSSDGKINLRIQGSDDRIQFSTEQALLRAIEDHPVLCGAYHSLL